ncbi:MAG: hypothetical protein J6T38_01770 [Bacteroidaceae bacterium]|nr:hypothetical protein [Bacteroidaceae bacterium]
MKQTIIYACMLTLSLCGLVGCNGMSKSSGSDADSIVADSQVSTLIEDETKEAQSDAPTLDVEKYWAQFQEMYQEGDLDDIHETLTKYAFIDIDEDGTQEVWLRSENDEDGAIFCFDDEEEPVLIITETEGKRPSVGKGWVGVGFPAGGPSYFNHYVIIKNSRKAIEFTDFQVEENHEYYVGDTEITEAEAKKIKEDIKGEGYLPNNLEWHQR